MKLIEIDDYKNISFEEMKNSTNMDYNGFKNHWLKMNDKYYYFKELSNEFSLIQELLGEEVTKAFGLKSIHYELGKCSGKIGLLSENFRDNHAKYFGMDNFDPIQNFMIKKTNLRPLKIMKSDLQNEILKLLARDFYALQGDRKNANLFFEKVDGIVRLAPLFDYEYSFINASELIYYSGIGVLNISDVYLWFKKYPKLKEELLKILLLDIKKMLSNIKEYYGIMITPEVSQNIIDFDKHRKELVKGYIK